MVRKKRFSEDALIPIVISYKDILYDKEIGKFRPLSEKYAPFSYTSCSAMNLGFSRLRHA